MAIRVNFRNVPGFLMLLLGAIWLSVIIAQVSSHTVRRLWARG